MMKETHSGRQSPCIGKAQDRKETEERTDATYETDSVRVQPPIKAGGRMVIVTEDYEIEAARSLIASGADINARDENGLTALMRTVQHNATETAALLIKAGADVNARDRYGETALIKAALYDKAASAKLLIEAGADINVQDNDGRTALMRTAGHSCTDVADLLMSAEDCTKGSGRTALVHAALRNDAARVQSLIEAGADSNETDGRSETALMYAVKNRAAEAAKALIEAGADVDM